MEKPKPQIIATNTVDASVDKWKEKLNELNEAKSSRTVGCQQSGCDRMFETDRDMRIHARACKLKVNYINKTICNQSLPVSPSEMSTSSPRISPPGIINTPLTTLRAGKAMFDLHQHPYVIELENRIKLLENKLMELEKPPPPPPSTNEEFYKETIRALISKIGTSINSAPIISTPPITQQQQKPQPIISNAPPQQSIIIPNVSPPEINSKPPLTPNKHRSTPIPTPTVEKLTPTKPPKKVDCLIIGDSIVKHAKGGKIGKPLKKWVKVCSYPGAGSEKVADHAEVELKYLQPETVIIHAGGNDVANDIDVSEVADNLAYLALELKDRGVKKIALSSQTPRVNCKDKITKLNKAISNVCRTYKLDHIDNSNIKYSFRGRNGQEESHLTDSDFIHLNFEGIKILQNNYKKYLTESEE